MWGRCSSVRPSTQSGSAGSQAPSPTSRSLWAATTWACGCWSPPPSPTWACSPPSCSRTLSSCRAWPRSASLQSALSTACRARVPPLQASRCRSASFASSSPSISRSSSASATPSAQLPSPSRSPLSSSSACRTPTCRAPSRSRSPPIGSSLSSPSPSATPSSWASSPCVRAPPPPSSSSPPPLRASSPRCRRLTAACLFWAAPSPPPWLARRRATIDTCTQPRVDVRL
mmetsp:Transcript_69709/g.191287  ORF Transcript_69709/g.191287 Transcript_69709/m.191287 type:complete len:229 (-) Transcript_69709:173-859(-)